MCILIILVHLSRVLDLTDVKKLTAVICMHVLVTTLSSDIQKFNLPYKAQMAQA